MLNHCTRVLFTNLHYKWNICCRIRQNHTFIVISPYKRQVLNRQKVTQNKIHLQILVYLTWETNKQIVRFVSLIWRLFPASIQIWIDIHENYPCTIRLKNSQNWRLLMEFFSNIKAIFVHFKKIISILRLVKIYFWTYEF